MRCRRSSPGEVEGPPIYWGVPSRRHRPASGRSSTPRRCARPPRTSHFERVLIQSDGVAEATATARTSVSGPTRPPSPGPSTIRAHRARRAAARRRPPFVRASEGGVVRLKSPAAGGSCSRGRSVGVGLRPCRSAFRSCHRGRTQEGHRAVGPGTEGRRAGGQQDPSRAMNTVVTLWRSGVHRLFSLVPGVPRDDHGDVVRATVTVGRLDEEFAR